MTTKFEKLVKENPDLFDAMDCRPLRRDTGIKYVPECLLKLRAAAEKKKRPDK